MSFREKDASGGMKKNVIPESNFTTKETNSNNLSTKRPTKGSLVSLNKTASGACFYGNVRNDGMTGEFSGMNYPHSREMLKVISECL